MFSENRVKRISTFAGKIQNKTKDDVLKCLVLLTIQRYPVYCRLFRFWTVKGHLNQKEMLVDLVDDENS